MDFIYGYLSTLESDGKKKGHRFVRIDSRSLIQGSRRIKSKQTTRKGKLCELTGIKELNIWFMILKKRSESCATKFGWKSTAENRKAKSR